MSTICLNVPARTPYYKNVIHNSNIVYNTDLGIAAAY